MKDAAIKAIAEMAAKPMVFNIGGQQHLMVPRLDPMGSVTYERQHPEQPLPAVATLEIHTLKGLVDYLEANLDQLATPLAAWPSLAVHVVSEAQVNIISKIESFDQPARRVYATARFERLVGTKAFEFGQFMEQEALTIALLSLFEDDGADRAALLQLVGNITDGMVTQLVDDGVTQEVSVKAGVTRTSLAPVTPIVTLFPYRTFREVAQPGGMFLVRIRSGAKEGMKPQVALFEADGGAWRLDAINRIADYLADKLKDRIAIIA